MSNPFLYGNPIPPNKFIGRQDELLEIVDRLVPHGQSVAVVGEPRSGKTSLLEYLMSPQAQEKYLHTDGEGPIFSYLDNQGLPAQCDQAGFWALALQPFYDRVIAPGSPLAQAYASCRQNGFGTFTMERLLAQMNEQGRRLVLLLDEFDAVLHHPTLNSAEFFGGLRALASRSRGALALVIASRQPLQALNQDTQQFSRTGSPYFNFLSEITLGPLADKEISALLSLAGERFSANDRRFIVEMAGGHPYLLQAAAYGLWRACEKGYDNAPQRRRLIGEMLNRQAAGTISDSWRLWPPMTRMAFVVAALPQILTISKTRKFDLQSLFDNVRDLGPELRLLQKRGLVMEDRNALSGWRARPQAFVWWLADEITRTVRDEPSLSDWLSKQEWEGLLTRKEKEWVGKAVHATAGLLKDGAKTLIEAAAKGAGGALV